MTPAIGFPFSFQPVCLSTRNFYMEVLAALYSQLIISSPLSIHPQLGGVTICLVIQAILLTSTLPPPHPFRSSVPSCCYGQLFLPLFLFFYPSSPSSPRLPEGSLINRRSDMLLSWLKSVGEPPLFYSSTPGLD